MLDGRRLNVRARMLATCQAYGIPTQHQIHTIDMKPGSWVVCVDDRNWEAFAYRAFKDLPVMGRTYRVRRLIDDITGKYGGKPGVALEGIYGALLVLRAPSGAAFFEEAHFRMDRFREVDPPFGEEVETEVLLQTLSAN